MSRRENFQRNIAKSQHHKKQSNAGSPCAFSLGDPESVLSTSFTDYLGVFLDGNENYYTPPISLAGLAKLQNANVHHGSALYLKRNSVMRFYIDNPLLPISELTKAAYEFFLYGQCYFQVIKNRLSGILRLVLVPGLNVRRMKEKNRYGLLQKNGELKPFKKGEIIHLKEYDVMQQIYGVPNYMAAIQAALLNEDATLFRRRYYKNGAHMGFVFYVGGDMDPDDEDTLKEQIKDSKGVGNFRSLFLNIPNGKKDSVQIIPIGDIATKDEFERVKNISRNDVISMHRIQPALAGIMPEEKGGFGDIEKIMRVDYETEIVPRQLPFLELNEYLPPGKRIGFRTPDDDNDSS
jgi:PBSX family phage portal protein